MAKSTVPAFAQEGICILKLRDTRDPPLPKCGGAEYKSLQMTWKQVMQVHEC